MKIIKIFLWIVTVLIMAYFLSDLKIGGQTIKQRVDGLIHGHLSGGFKSKAREWLGDHREDSFVSESHRAPKEEITSDDQKKLDKLFREKQ